MHNLGTVFTFEVIRALKKKTFWFTAFSFPVVIALIFAVIFFSNQATQEATLDTQKQTYSLGITDESNVIKPDLLQQFNPRAITDKQNGIDLVKNGTLDAYFYYPTNVTKQAVEVYATDVGLFDNSRYQATAKALLTQSTLANTSPQVVSILQDSVEFKDTMYKDGRPYNAMQQLIAPGMFLVLFYILITMFGSQMLTSTTEEKENRVIEMLLTTIKARTLIIGKILSLTVLSLIQIIAILVPIILLYLLFGNQVNLPNIDLNTIPIDPTRMVIGTLLFTGSFFLFTGLMVAIGAAMPTAREASGFFGLILMFLFGPLYAFTLFISAPQSQIVTFLSYFPLTAPIPLLLRNAVGNLSINEALIGIAVLGVSAVIVLAIAVRLFRYGALEYNNRLSLKTVFSSDKK